MRPVEFLLLIAFWFGPPCLITGLIQAWGIARYRASLRWKSRALVLLGTSVTSVMLGLAALIASPEYLRFLGVIDVRIGERAVPFLPLAYVVVAVIAIPVTWLICRKRSEAVRREQ